MQLSQLIEHLQSLLDKEGDMPVRCRPLANGAPVSDVDNLIHWDHPANGEQPYAEIG